MSFEYDAEEIFRLVCLSTNPLGGIRRISRVIYSNLYPYN